MASFVLIWVFLLATYGLENCTATFFYDSGVALVGTGGTTEAEQGNACAISGDNSTILVGGYRNGLGNGQGYLGAAWVFERNSTSPTGWSQIGNKLYPNDTGGQDRFGSSVAVNYNGTIAVISGIGAIWTFMKDSKTGLWEQSGVKILPNEYPFGNFGSGVSMSSDGSIAAVAGSTVNHENGVVWFFDFDFEAATYIQNGKMLVGTVLYSGPGASVALSGDGNTCLLGASTSNSALNNIGIVYVYNRDLKTNIWYESSYLSPSDYTIGINLGGSVINVLFGSSAAINFDGTIAVVGGLGDDYYLGAAWVFNRTDKVINGNTTWVQDGTKLTLPIPSSTPRFGSAVGIDKRGSLIAIGAPADTVSAVTSGTGSVTIFLRSASSWNHSGHSLIANYSTSGMPGNGGFFW